jgi:single-stranded-DNA-specific exonuclease
MQKRWLVKTPLESTVVEEFRSKLKVDRVVGELLLKRGVDSYEKAEEFFNPDLGELHDPFLIKGLPEAVSRLSSAIERKEKIMLFGDYDVDGTTAVALMYTVLRTIADVEFYIPDRYTEGYGLSKAGIDKAIDENCPLMITLDCGIRSIELIAYAKSKGLDVIVCDHHQPGKEIPDCIVLDAKQQGCAYPYKELSGCGVGFKLLQGLSTTMEGLQDEVMKHLDLVAVSIGADIVDVTGENRILAYHGLAQLNKAPRRSFKTLIEIAQREFPLSLTDVVFTIAPRINAAGRLRSGKFAVQLMISEDEEEIRTLAFEIDTDNRERREIDQLITAEAIELLNDDVSFERKKSTVVFKNDWHKGVVGIVASRLVETYFKPTIVLTESNGFATGSARTVNDFDIHHALTRCSHLLEQFGGHTHAAGMTLKLENVDLFMTAFETVVQELLSIEDESPEEIVEMEIQFDQIFTTGEDRMKVPRLKRILNRFEPHGPGNMKPVFLSTNVFVADCRILKEKHLKLSLIQPTNDVRMEAIGFNLIDKYAEIGSGIPFEIIYTIETNKWMGKETVQLNIKDMRTIL